MRLRCATAGAFVGISIAGVVAVTMSASAAPPFDLIRVLAKAHGFGAVTVTASTKGLRHRVWLYRLAGMRVAYGTASASCWAKYGNAATGTDQFFRFTIKPRHRQAIWRYSGSTPCTLTVHLTGPGHLNVELRGY